MFCVQIMNFRPQWEPGAAPAAETLRSLEIFPVNLDVSRSGVTPAGWPLAQKPVTCRASAGAYKRNPNLRCSFPKKGNV